MKLSTTQKDSFKAAAVHYNRSVHLARTYLHGRSLWDDALVDTFLLGVVDEPHEPEHEFVQGRLCIPYQTPNGIVNLKFRCIEAHDCKEVPRHLKYLGLPGAEDRVYNVQALHDADDVIYMTEGELDAIHASVAGFPAIGISGANKWRDHYRKLLEDFREVVVLADGDAAGQEFAKRVRSELRNARVVHMPTGEDVNSFLSENYVEDLAELVDTR